MYVEVYVFVCMYVYTQLEDQVNAHGVELGQGTTTQLRIGVIQQ